MTDYQNHNMTTSTYGAIETNGLCGGPNVDERGPQPGCPALHNLTEEEQRLPVWANRNFKRFVRIRLLSDPGYPCWDLSYAYIELIDGSRERISDGLPGQDGYGCFPKANYHNNEPGWAKRAVVDAKKFGVYLKGECGFFDAISTLQ
jgi:hypothetical protein